MSFVVLFGSHSVELSLRHWHTVPAGIVYSKVATVGLSLHFLHPPVGTKYPLFLAGPYLFFFTGILPLSVIVLCAT